MRRMMCLWMVFLGTLFASVALFAVDAPFSTAPAPTQVYHAVSSEPSTTPVAQVTTPSPVPTASPDMTNGAAVINPAGVGMSSQGQVSSMNQVSTAFEQQADQSIQNLNDSNRAMAIAIQSINQNIAQLQTQVAQLQSTMPHATVASKYGEYLDVGGAAVFMLGFGVVLGRIVRRRSSESSPVNAIQGKRIHPSLNGNEDTKNEYDFMGTQEAIPAKLDLARSYMAMNEYEQAHTVLKTVMEKGTEEQRIEAQLLTNKMNSRKNDN